MKQLPLPDRNTAVRLLHTLAGRVPEVGPRAVDRPLILYGTGNLGRLAAELLDKLGIEVAYAVDQSPPKDGLLLDKIPVIQPEMAPKADRESHLLAICVVLAPYAPICESLISQGWRNVIPFYDIAEAYAAKFPMGNGWFAGGLEETERMAIERTLLKWDDDISRAAHLQFLAWRMYREEWCFDGAEINTSDRYFPDFIRHALRSDETFLDAGAYIGDVCRRFESIAGSRYSELIAIEADPKNNTQLRANLAQHESIASGNIRIFDFALSNKNGTVAFCSELGIGARVFLAGNNSIQCRRLDDLNLSFSFAKLHLEGGELDAITGAMNSFKRNRPILAITVYHSKDGLHQIPLQLMENLENYRFFLRIHAWCGTGVVLYAIPTERSYNKTNEKN